MRYLFPVLFFVLIFSLPAYSQKSKSQLEKEKSENLKKIRETEKIIQETRSRKEATLGQLSAIQQQIMARQGLIASISREISLLSNEVSERQDLIDALESDLEALKEEYAAMIYAASKINHSHDRLTFIFSAETFNQLIRRLRYFRHYADMRQMQVEQIEKLKVYLSEQKEQLSKKKDAKSSLLASKTIENENLNNLLKEQDRVLKQLSSREKQLKSELDSRKKAVDKLEILIADLVRKEMERAKRAAEIASSSFEESAKKLKWPVSRGEISHKFGKQPHPVLKNVYVDNLGVDIITLRGEPVRAVFKGKVITVASVPGMNNVVMIQHGEYFTVYAKLKNVKVKTGDEVNVNDILGEVYTDKNDVSELQFQIWKNNEKLDPEKWLQKK
ncbi:peptidoglycan DD-metalloendopeptidase family protein [Cytophagaceae bacterium ABcell3]|nr:peptidoglycan DD-metalloendopeptidase family protein [Cytophagaceae bacterium ABcell3]